MELAKLEAVTGETLYAYFSTHVGGEPRYGVWKLSGIWFNEPEKLVAVAFTGPERTVRVTASYYRHNPANPQAMAALIGQLHPRLIHGMCNEGVPSFATADEVALDTGARLQPKYGGGEEPIDWVEMLCEVAWMLPKR